MKKMLPLLLSLFIYLLQNQGTVNAQCGLTNSIFGTACTGHILTASVSAIPCAIEWQLNGTTVHSEFPLSWSSSGTTVAGGNGIGSGANQFGNSTPYSTSTAGGIAVDASGNIYICDNPNHRIQKWAPGATEGITVAGGNGAGSGADQLNNPSDVFVDQAGNVYVCDNYNARVQKWAPGATSGVTVAGGNSFGSNANQFSSAFQIFVDADGNVYVSDNGNYRVQKWAPGATTGVTVAGGNGYGSAANQLGYSSYIFVDATGNLYLSDTYNQRIQKWAPGATEGVTIAGGGIGILEYPRSIYVDAAGNMMLIANGFNGNHRLMRWAAGATEGKTLMGKISYGNSPDPFNTVTDMTLDYNGNIVLIDGFNFRVQQFNIGGIINTFAPVAAGNYQAVALSYGTGCAAVSNTITVEPAPVVTSSASEVVCGGSNIVLTASGGTSFTWQPGNLSGAVQTFAPVNTSTYSVTSDVNSCVTEATINVFPTPEVTISGDNCTGHLLTATLNAIPAKLEWQLDGNTVSTKIPSWNKSGTTVAGGNGDGSGLNQFTNTSYGITADKDGNLYVADAGNHRIQKWAAGATFGETVAGGNGQGSAANQLYNPTGICLDAAGNLYIADGGNNRVQKWAPGAGSGTTVAGGNGFGSALNQLKYPSYVQVDASGNVYVLDGWDNARVMKWAPGATEGVVVAAGNGQGNADNQINLGTGMVMDEAGNIYVTDWYANRVQKWAPGATIGETIMSGFYLANGLFADGSGTFYVINSPYVSPHYESHVVRFRVGDYAYEEIIPAGYGAAANQLAGATNGCFDNAGKMYVLDGGNRRVQQFTVADIPATYTPSTPGNYSALATSFAGCQSSSNSITALQSPIAVSQVASICAGSNNQLSVSGGSSYTWNPGNLSGNTVTVSPAATTTYTVTDNATNCTTQIMAFVPASSSPVIAGTSCLESGNLTVMYAQTPAILEWKLNGNTVATSAATYSNDNKTVVAGGNGNGADLNQTKYPRGMALDAQGNVYVAEEGNNRVTKWAPGATQGVVVAGGNGNGSGANQLSYPEGVFVDKFNNIYVADQNNARIQKWAPGATEGVTVAGGHGTGSALNQLSNPLSVYVDDAGNIYIPDQSNHRVVLWTPGATQGIVVAGGNGQGSAANQFYWPIQLTFDKQGNLYVADYGNHRISKWTPGATEGITVAGGNGAGFNNNQVGNAQGVAVDGEGNVYALSGYNSYITKWAPGASTGTYLAGYCCSPPGGINGAYSLMADASGNLYVADYANSRVVRFNAAISGSEYTPAAAGDYTIAATQFNGCISTSAIHIVYPKPVISLAGNLFFCEASSTTVDAGMHETYNWSTGSTAQTETFSAAGNYSLTVSDSGCTTTNNFSIAAQSPVVNVSANPSSTCVGSPVQLSATLVSGGVETQTMTYYIDGNHLAGMPNSCSNNSRYGYYWDGAPGVSYIDAGMGTATSVKVEFNVGYDYGAGSQHSVSLNGYSTGAGFTAPHNAACNAADPANFMTVTFTPSNYHIGGSNTIYFSNPYYFGLTPSPAINNYYAKVTVDYLKPAVTYSWQPNGDTITNPLVHPLTTTTYTLTADSKGCSSVSTVNVNVAAAPGDTAVFGDHVWNVYAFNAGGSTNTGHSWNEAYSGYYIDNNLNFNTQTNWASNASPSAASGYSGCAVNSDNHSWSAKRKGFTCGTYKIDVTGHENEGQLFVNGVKVWEHTGSGDSHANVWTGFLDDNSTVVFRATAGTGNSSGGINFTLQSFITVNGPVTICPGYSVQLTAGSADSYLWSTGETTQSISASSSGTYTVDMTSNGCTNTASQVITVTPLDTAVISSYYSPDFSFCPSQGSIDLKIGYNPLVTRLWNTGSTSTIIYVSAAGDYSVTIQDALGCSATSHVTVSTDVAGEDSTFGDNVWKVNAYAQGYYSYYYGYYTSGRAWYPDDYSGYYLDSSLNFNSEDEWDADSNPSTATGYHGCSIGDDLVSWNAKRQGFPCGIYQINILGHDDDAQLLIDGVKVWEHLGCCDVHNNVWTGPLNASSKVEFMVNEMYGGDNGAIEFIPVSGTSNFINVSGNPVTCDGQFYTLTSKLLGTYQWSNGETTNPILAGSSGSFAVTVTDAAGCTLTSDPVSVTILPNPAPVAHINASANSICDWIPVTLSSDSTNGNFWSNYQVSQSIIITQGGSYSLTVTNNVGCTDQSSIDIGLGYTLPAPVATVSDTICEGNGATLTASGLAPGGQVASFNGYNQYINVTQDIPESNLTIEMWVKTTAAYTGIFSVTDGFLGNNGNDRHLYLHNGELYVRTWQGNGWNTGAYINDGKWHHIALTIETGVGQKVYVDGIQAPNISNYDHSDFITQTQFNIGFSNDAYNQFFDGQIDNVRIWSEARTEADIRSNMFSETPAIMTNLVYEATLNGNANAVIGNNGTSPNGMSYTSANYYTYQWTGTGAPAASSSETQTTSAINADAVYQVGASLGGCSVTMSNTTGVTVLPNTTYYADADGDGYGSSSAAVQLFCSDPGSGYSLNHDDCDDLLASVHPGAADICNNIDDNCNTIIDENAVSVSISADGPTTFCSWSTVHLSAGASGAGSITYQWLNGNVPIPGATDAAYTPAVSGVYAVAVSNGICTDTANSTTVNILARPDAVIAPTGSLSVCKDVTVTFSANTGAGYAYQWYKGVAAVPGATNATYDATGVKKGFYSVLVIAPNGCYNHSDSTELIRLNVPPSVINILNPAGNPDLCINGQVKLRGTGGSGFTYEWYKNNVPTGVTSRDYIVTLEGNYTVKITNSYNCSKMSAPVSVISSCRGNENQAMEPMPLLSIYPNPTDGHFAVSLSLFNSFTGTSTVEVYNMLGQVVRSETVPVTDGELFSEMEIGEEMAATTYLLQIVADGQVFKQQVVVQH
ncbi:MAG: T9SS type A sorting domain-containing protein [Chitinophagales bacterium]|nr:T9SS type A sorting domain-containing protein [Chitinophagales bacterium]